MIHNPDVKLTLQAMKIEAAGEFSAVFSSAIRPLPHQLDAVYHEMLPREPLRYVLADDPGAGKTIMSGLWLKELLLKGSLSSCLIVAPGNLDEQWQDELSQKFRLRFSLLNDDQNADFIIARLDTLARRDSQFSALTQRRWDAVIIDEAHKLSASSSGSRTSYTLRYHLAQKLSKAAKNFLLLTATPHNGKHQDFRLFMQLVDEEKFSRLSPAKSNLKGSMRRLLKEDLLNEAGLPLFTQRTAQTISYTLSGEEQALYNAVTAYVRTQFDRADSLDSKRRHSVGFALTMLQRRLASSPEAICQSLEHRLERIEKRIISGKLDNRIHACDEDDIPDVETEADYATASRNVIELSYEADALGKLVVMAQSLRASGTDRKWNELSRLLNEGTAREKLIIFTEHKATLDYLADRIRTLTGRYDAVVTIDGSLSRAMRRNAQQAFTDNPEARILVATDAAGEGINLQCAHLMINYDLPWNPNRIEQRFGRIHRIGQVHPCRLLNLVADGTREGQVFTALFRKLEAERQALGGKVFDVLGKISFGGKSLSELLVEAIRTSNTVHLPQADFAGTIRQHSLTGDTLSQSSAEKLHAQLEENRLSPDFIADFFLKALPLLGGIVEPLGKGLFMVTYIPKSWGLAYPLTVSFTPRRGAELIAQGSPLLKALTSRLLVKSLAFPHTESSPVIIDRKSTESRAMLAVMTREWTLGRSPKDVSSLNLGYDIESSGRFIEVKGVSRGTSSVTVTANEMRFAIANPDTFILAIVEVSPEGENITYLTRCFRNEPEEEEVSRTFSIRRLAVKFSQKKV